MPHIKAYGRYRHVPGEGTRLAWFVLASHNLSKAAWGSLQKNGAPGLCTAKTGSFTTPVPCCRPQTAVFKSGQAATRKGLQLP